MYIVILFAMIFILSLVVIIVGLNTDKQSKAVHKIFFVSVAIIVGFYTYAKYTCGPNRADVKVMKPMAEKISEYIVKNGIPESLKDIPDLPYGLVRCEKHQKNLEKCIFYKNNTEYESEIYILGDVYIEIYSKQTKTGLRYELTKNSSTKNWLINKSNIAFSSKNSGICNPMRQ